MRPLSAVLLVALALGALPAPLAAQPAADPHDWHGYYPLEVGNAWETEATLTDADPATPERLLTRIDLVADTPTARGHGFVRVTRFLSFFPGPSRTDTTVVDTVLYDETLRRVVDTRRRVVTESLGAPLDSTAAPRVTMVRRAFAGLDVPVKRFHYATGPSAGVGREYAYGVGYFGRDCADGTCATTLAYARVGGVEYGRRVVAALPAVAPPAGGLRVWPNPAAGRATVAYGGPVGSGREVDVIDPLGRRVRHATTGADGRAALDVAGLPRGVYVVRVGETVRTLVVAR